MKIKSYSILRRGRVFLGIVFALAGSCMLPAASTVTVNSTDAVNRPFIGFGINWNPYWDKPSTLPATALSLSNDEWQTVFCRLNYLNLNAMRVMILPEWVNPTATSGGNDYNTSMMNALYDVLDYTHERNITVMFGFWDARAPFDGNEGSAVYIQSLTETVDYLVNTLGYTNIKYCILTNEPQHRFATYAEYVAATQALATSFSNAGLSAQVKIMGPDVGGDGQSWLGAASIDLKSQIGAYDWHYYPGAQNGIKDGSPGTLLAGHTSTITTNDPAATGKPLVLSEMGWFWGVTAQDDQPNIGTVQYAVEAMDLGIQSARTGWSPVAWYLDDQTNDRLWGMWDIKNSPSLRPWFYTWSLMTRHFRASMTLYKPTNPTDIRVLAGRQILNGSNRWSIALVNRKAAAEDVTVTIPGEGTTTLRHFVFTSSNNAKDGSGFPLPVDTVTGNLGSGGITVSVPANGAVVLSNITTSVSVDDRQIGTGTQQWSYAGSWTGNYWGLVGEYNTTATYSNSTNATATVSFVGTQVKLYGKPGPGGGYAAVKIDGGAETTGISFYSTVSDGNVLLWTSPVLSYGTHTLVVRVQGTKPAASSGTYVPIDRIEIIP